MDEALAMDSSSFGVGVRIFLQRVEDPNLKQRLEEMGEEDWEREGRGREGGRERGGEGTHLAINILALTRGG